MSFAPLLIWVPGSIEHFAPIKTSSSMWIFLIKNLSCSMPNVIIVEFMPKITFLPTLRNSEDNHELSTMLCFPIFTPKNRKENLFLHHGKGFEEVKNKGHFLMIFRIFQKRYSLSLISR